MIKSGPIIYRREKTKQMFGKSLMVCLIGIIGFASVAWAVCPVINSCEDLTKARKAVMKKFATEGVGCEDCVTSDLTDEAIAAVIAPPNPKARVFLSCMQNQVQLAKMREIRRSDLISKNLRRLKIEGLSYEKIQELAQQSKSSELNSVVTGKSNAQVTYEGSIEKMYKLEKPLPPESIFADFKDAMTGFEKRSPFFPDTQQPAMSSWFAQQILIQLVASELKTDVERKSFLKSVLEPEPSESRNLKVIEACLTKAARLSSVNLQAADSALKKQMTVSDSKCEFEWFPGDLVKTETHAFVVMGYSERKGRVELNTIEIPGRNVQKLNVINRATYVGKNCEIFNVENANPYPDPSAIKVWSWKD